MSSTITSWPRVKELIKTGKLDQLVRSKETAEEYRVHKASLRNIDVSLYILSRLNWSIDELAYLNTYKFPSTNDKIAACLTDKGYYKITKNDYPYNFESDVYHLLVWSKINIPLYDDDTNESTKNVHMYDRIEEFLELNVHQRLKISKDDYCWFINYVSLQSIRSISHIHLLIRTSDRDIIEKKILMEQDFAPLTKREQY